MKIIAEVGAGIMNDEWCFSKPIFSGLYSSAQNATRQNDRAPNRSRQTGGAKTSRTHEIIESERNKANNNKKNGKKLT